MEKSAVAEHAWEHHRMAYGVLSMSKFKRLTQFYETDCTSNIEVGPLLHEVGPLLHEVGQLLHEVVQLPSMWSVSNFEVGQ